jgi:predicted glycosyltransferase
MAAAGLVVAMGGYNTSAEILATGARSVLVPRTWRPGEHCNKGKTGFDAEQLVRVEGLTRLGAVAMVDPRELSAETLAVAMQHAVARPRQKLSGELQLDGAARVADCLIQLADSKRFGGSS